MMGSFVNFNDSYLNHILRNAFHNHDLSVDSNDDDKPSIEPSSQSSHIEQCSTSATLLTMNTDGDNDNDHHHLSDHRQYCLVVFNNPKWSTILQRRNQAQVYGEVKYS